MFNFFNKKKEDPIREHLGGFQDNFTKEQKAAILGSLVILAKSDGQVHPKEMQNIEQTGRLLGIELDDPVFARVASGGKNEITRILNTLDRSQKEWYIITLHSMVAADGKVEEIEISYALGFADDIGISEDEYVQIIQKAELLMKKFMG